MPLLRKCNCRVFAEFSNGAVLTLCYFAAIIVIGASFLKERSVLGQNDASRWDTVWSLTHQRGYIIDSAPYPTVDRVYRDGHFYSSKPGLMPTVVAGLTFILSKITELSLPESDYMLTRFVLLTINLIPFISFVFLYGRWLIKLPCSSFSKWICLCTAASGTYLTTYNITLNNHTVAASGIFLALLFFENIVKGDDQRSSSYFICGLSSAWAFANEMISFPFWIFIFASLLKWKTHKTLLCFLPASVIILAALCVTTILATGDCIPYYLKQHTYRYPGSYWDHPSGIDAIRESKVTYLFHHVIGHHGILSLTPIFVFAFIGMFSQRTSKHFRIAAVWLSMINLAIVIAGRHNYGGICQGARWFMWLIPLWLFCMPSSVDLFNRTSKDKLFTITILGVSIFSVCYGMFAHPAGPWSPSWIQDSMRELGWISYY